MRMVATMIKSFHGFGATQQRLLTNRANRWNRTENVCCDIRSWFYAFETVMRVEYGVPIMIASGYRTPAEQLALFNSGRSQRRDSAHSRGMALDVIHSVRGWNVPDDFWINLAAVGFEVARKRDLPLRWGGDWNGNGVPVKLDPKESFWDAAHFEIKGWAERPDCPPCDCNGGCMPYFELDTPR